MGTIREKFDLAFNNKKAIQAAIKRKVTVEVPDDMSKWAEIIDSIQYVDFVTMKITSTGSATKIFNDGTWILTGISQFKIDGVSASPTTSVTLEEGEHEISFLAFSLCSSCFYGCTAIIELSLPSTIESIGGSFISGCSGLSSITIAEGLETVSDNAFTSTYLTSLTFPDSVKTIGSSCFTGNSKLTTITLPKNLESIGASACAWTSCIKYMNYNNTVENWVKITKGSDWANGAGFGTVTCTNGIAFALMPSSTQIYYSTTDNTQPGYSDFGITYNYGYYNSDYGALNFGSDVTTIPENAFTKITKLKGIALPGTITSIGANAFNGCTSIENISFNGTKETWETITLDGSWNSGSAITKVICTDGVIEL